MRNIWVAWIVAAFMGIADRATAADPLETFYKGRSISLLVGGSAGGGYDSWARAVARFIGKHLPGAPTIVVRNMPGAGGIAALNFLANTAERDGSVIGLVPNNTPVEPLFGAVEARYDAVKLNWLGTPSTETSVVLVWHNAKVKDLADLKVTEATMGGSGAQSTPSFYTRLLNEVLGTRMKLINGYQGQNEVFLAMERGEVDGFPSVFFSSLSATRPQWIPQGLARPIVQYGPDRIPELADVPFATDLLSNEDDKLLMQAATAAQALGRPFVAPPDVPDDRLAALRQALSESFIDPEFRAAADKLGLIVNAPRSGQQLQEVIAAAYATPSRIVERLRRLNNP